MAKALDCAVGGVAFGKCAAWVGLTFRLDMPKSAQIRGLVARIEVTGATILNAEARILLVEVPILKQGRIFLNHPAYFTESGCLFLSQL